MARPKEHSPDDILTAATSVFIRDGISASTASIAKHAGVSNGSLFNYFPTKQALIDALYLSVKTQMADAIGELDGAQPVEKRIRQIWDHLFVWASANREAHRVASLLHESGLASADAQAQTEQRFRAPLATLVEAHESDILVDLPLDYLGGLMQQHLDHAVASQLDAQEADIAFAVLWNGITRSPTTPRTNQESEKAMVSR